MHVAYGCVRNRSVMIVTVATTSLVCRYGMEGSEPPDLLASEPMGPAMRGSIFVLAGAERGIFVLVGALFFVAAFALAIRSTLDLWALAIGPRDQIIVSGTAFLNVMLLVLMMVELAYTVIVSLRGTVLAAEPFLIVGLIAVIRRILVITIGDVGPTSAPAPHAAAGAASQPVELGVLTGVVLVLVFSIVLLRRRAPAHAEPRL